MKKCQWRDFIFKKRHFDTEFRDLEHSDNATQLDWPRQLQSVSGNGYRQNLIVWKLTTRDESKEFKSYKEKCIFSRVSSILNIGVRRRIFPVGVCWLRVIVTACLSHCSTLFLSVNMLWQLSSSFFRPHLTKDILFYLLKFVITTNHLLNRT